MDGEVEISNSPSRRKKAWDRFASNESLLRTYNVREEELAALGQAALLGTAQSEKDFLFMLNVIRRGRRR